jgi:transcriptional regulator with XRE-family HTH domain
MINEAIVRETLTKLFVHRMTFGEWLREKLKEARMSNAELARWVDVSPTYIGNLVRDYSPNTKSGKAPRPSERLVEKIAKAVKADPDEARQAAGYAPQTPLFPPKTKAELVAALEKIGVEHIEFSNDISESSPEQLQELFDAVKLAVEITLSRQGRK